MFPFFSEICCFIKFLFPKLEFTLIMPSNCGLNVRVYVDVVPAPIKNDEDPMKPTPSKVTWRCQSSSVEFF